MKKEVARADQTLGLGDERGQNRRGKRRGWCFDAVKQGSMVRNKSERGAVVQWLRNWMKKKLLVIVGGAQTSVIMLNT